MEIIISPRILNTESVDSGLLKDQLVAGLMALSEKIQRAGFAKVLFNPETCSSKSWDYFDSLPEIQKLKILDDFKVYSDLMSSVVAENNDLSDNTSTLWAAMRSLGVLPTNDIFTQLESDDVIEIYRNDGLQVFRNMRFHEISSYYLHDLFIRPWEDLFIRDPLVTREIQTAAYLSFTGQVPTICDLKHIPTHTVFEKDSPGMYVMKMSLRFVAPLRDKNGGIPYGIAVSKVEVLEKEQAAEESLALIEL
jgi:hypothetical protein